MLATHRRNRGAAASLLLVGGICLASLAHSPAAAQPLSAAPALVQIIDTSRWNPPSPDPSGITYWPGHDTLIVADGEVEEMPIFAGANIFESTRRGALVRTYNIASFNNEPVGIDIDTNPTNGHFFISNDSAKRIFEIDIGPDGQFNSGDDRIRSFLTSSFGNNDPEGLTLGQINGRTKLFTADGAGRKVYISDPGPNGIFDGAGDDVVTRFDVVPIGIGDPEGIDYNPDTGTLYIVDRKNRRIFETTVGGALVRTIDLRFVNAVNPGDLTLAPGSDDPSVKHLYIADRGVDNNVDPNENDGKIYEITLGDGAPLPPSGNLLGNPGFETDANGDGGPDVWSTNSRFKRSSGAVHGGSFAGRFFATDNSGATIRQIVQGVSPSSTYNFSAWVNIPTTSDGFTFRIQVKWRDSSNSVLRTDTLATFTDDNGGAWSQATARWTPPAGTTNAAVQMTVSSLNATIYVDDFSFGL